MQAPEYDQLALEPFSDAPTKTWQWRKVQAAKRTFALRSDDTLLAGLRFEKSSGSLATADTAQGRLSFKRTGVFKVRMTVWRAGTAEELGVFTPKWHDWGGGLELAGGRRFSWRGVSMWSTGFEWASEDGTVLLRLEHSSKSKTEADVTLAPEGLAEPELPLLVTFGYYLLVLMADDMVAIAGAAGAGG